MYNEPSYTIRKVEEAGTDRYYYQVIKYTPEFSATAFLLVPNVMKTTKTRTEAEQVLIRKKVYSWNLEREIIKTHAFIDCIV